MTNNPHLVPTSRPSDLSSFTLLMDGEPVSATFQVVSLTVTRQANHIPNARVVLLDGDLASGDFPAAGGDVFTPGKEIEIKIGYHGDESTLFKGLVLRQSLKARASRPSTLSLECRDIATKLTLARRSAFYYQTSDSEIAGEILQDAGLESDLEDTAVVHTEMVRYRCTDWDFMLMRLDAAGLLVLVEDGLVRAVRPALDKEPALVVTYGSTMIEFEAFMEARGQVDEVTAKAWNPADQALIEAEADVPAGSQSEPDTAALAALFPSELLTHAGRRPDEELQAWADARKQKSLFSRIRGRVKCQGFDIKPGQILELQGVSERYNGKVYVVGVCQQVNNGHWTSDIQFGLSPQWFAQEHACEAPAAAGLVAGIRGLEVGVVRQLEEDPEGEARILVNLPTLDPEAEGIWCRIARLDAGSARGSFFLPEVNDEVVVGFLNGDPRDGIVLGMLHSSNKTAPIEASKDNHEKGFVTRSGLRLWFHDETKTITVDTPGGNAFQIGEKDDKHSISLKDNNGNELVMDQDGIALTSAGDMKLEAAGDLLLSAKNIEVKASSELAAKGDSSMTLESGGSAVLKGATVAIN